MEKSILGTCTVCKGDGKETKRCPSCRQGRTYKKVREVKPCDAPGCMGGLYSPKCKSCDGTDKDCLECQGTGRVLWKDKEGLNKPQPGTHMKGFTHLTFMCRKCKGEGEMSQVRYFPEQCGECGGTAMIFTGEKCPECLGTGDKGLGFIFTDELEGVLCQVS